MVLILLVAGLSVFLLRAFSCFDKLVRLEYEKHRDDWNNDGRPDGFFWRPPERDYFRSALAVNRLRFAWLFRTPPWAQADPEAPGYLRAMRINVLIWNIGVLCLLAGALAAENAAR